MSFQVARNTALPVGAITQYALAMAPVGWILCDGGQYAVATYPLLDALLGTTYGARTDGSGGAGSTHFRVPDARGRVAVGAGTGAGGGATGSGSVPSGGSALTARSVSQWIGAETHTLSIAELAVHDHVLHRNNQSPTLAADLSNAYRIQKDSGGSVSGYTTQNAGSGTAHNNVQPIIVVSYIIKAT